MHIYVGRFCFLSYNNFISIFTFLYKVIDGVLSKCLTRKFREDLSFDFDKQQSAKQILNFNYLISFQKKMFFNQKYFSMFYAKLLSVFSIFKPF